MIWLTIQKLPCRGWFVSGEALGLGWWDDALTPVGDHWLGPLDLRCSDGKAPYVG